MEKVCAMCKVQGADVNNVNIVDQKGFTSLMNAIDYDHNQCARILLDAGADVNIADFKFVKMFLKEGAGVNIVDNRGSTALILAAEKYNIEIVAALIEAGAYFNVAGENGVTALMNASCKG